MKKIFTLVLCLTMVSMAYSQEKKTSWGPKASFNLATITGSDGGAAMKPGFSAGLFGEYRMTNLFAISPEVVYSMQGVKVKDMDASLVSHYINIPILAKFYVIKNLSLEVGPQFGFALSASAKAAGVSVKMDSELYNMFDLSIAAGATYNIQKFLVSARYNIGMTNFVKDGSNKNGVLQIGVGYRF